MVVFGYVPGRKLTQQKKGIGKIVVIYLPTASIFIQYLKNCPLQLVDIPKRIPLLLRSFRHIDPAAGRSREGKEAVGPGRARHRGKPSVTNREVSCKSVKGRERSKSVISHDLLTIFRSAIWIYL